MLRSILLAGACLALTSPTVAADYPFVFRDVGDQTGLFPSIAGIEGHAAGWGDIDGDGWVDLYVGTFHRTPGQPNLLFRNKQGKFQLDEQPTPRISTRASAAVFADLDNDGDLDLYVSSMPQAKPAQAKGKVQNELVGCSLFSNDGQGNFTNITAGNGACPAAFGGRSATVVDFDGDGLLDLLVGEDPVPGYNGSKTKNARLFRNLGKLQFEDATAAAGLPAADMPGLGVAAGDVNNDGWPDLFVAANSGGNRLFVNDGKGHFQELAGSRETFAWAGSGGDNMICGATFGDVNRDGLLDLVVGQHYSSPWKSPVPIRLYLNRGVREGQPVLEDVTSTVGLTPLGMKAPHVEVQDYDNDGWPDISASIVKFAGDKPCPVIFKNLGVENGLPKFRDDAWGVNDFPNEADLAAKKTGDFFKKLVSDHRVIYMAPGPTADFDNDGRLDMFLANWWVDSRSLLLKNETPGGAWLQVQLQGSDGVNRMGIGARINVYRAGQAGNKEALLVAREMAVGFGYTSSQPAIAHFGLGAVDRVDVEVLWPHGKGKTVQANVPANQRLTIKRE